MIVCGLDTETTGLPDKRKKATDPGQARVLQLALKLMTPGGNILAQFSSLIKPDGWSEIHPKAFEAHGISIDMCQEYGIGMKTAYAMFKKYASMADMIVCHNAPFDKGMMQIEADCAGEEFPGNPWYCTMEKATPLCKIPPTAAMVAAGRDHYKAANLGEALHILCGKQLIGAHDAMVDVTGCLDVYLELQRRKEMAA